MNDKSNFLDVKFNTADKAERNSLLLQSPKSAKAGGEGHISISFNNVSHDVVNATGPGLLRKKTMGASAAVKDPGAI
jgi:hypothetical protein